MSYKFLNWHMALPNYIYVYTFSPESKQKSQSNPSYLIGYIYLITTDFNDTQ